MRRLRDDILLVAPGRGPGGGKGWVGISGSGEEATPFSFLKATLGYLEASRKIDRTGPEDRVRLIYPRMKSSSSQKSELLVEKGTLEELWDATSSRGRKSVPIGKKNVFVTSDCLKLYYSISCISTLNTQTYHRNTDSHLASTPRFRKHGIYFLDFNPVSPAMPLKSPAITIALLKKEKELELLRLWHNLQLPNLSRNRSKQPMSSKVFLQV